jgi:GTPase SAR1 family protein
MTGGDEELFLRADELSVRAGTVFKPRSPITTKELFAGRWNELMEISDAVHQPGLHVVVYGERGVGKTSLANVVKATVWAVDKGDKDEVDRRMVIKEVANTADSFSTIWNRLFSQISFPDTLLSPQHPDYLASTRRAFSLPDEIKIEDVRRVLSQTPGAVFILDEFDQASREISKSFTELIKALQDLVVDCTIILVGVSETIDKLIEDHASINRAIVQVKVERMRPDDLRQILENAEKVLGIKFLEDAASLIVNLSQGLPHYTHLIGLHAVRSAAHRLNLNFVERDDVFDALKKAVKQAEQSVAEKHTTAIHSAQKNALYRQVLLACAIAASRFHDALGYFTPGAVVEPLKVILDRQVTIATFTNHLVEFSQDKRGQILERDGQPWGYRYRFRDPLLVPYVFMDGIDSGIASDRSLVSMLGQQAY